MQIAAAPSPSVSPFVASPGVGAARPAPPRETSLRIAQFNAWNFFDTVDDPRTADAVLTEDGYRTKLAKISLAIRTSLGAPDIISLNEVENEHCLDDLVGLPEMRSLGYRYVMSVPNDERGIRTALLYRGDRIEKVGVESPNPRYSFPDRGKGQFDTSRLYSRPPLAVDFRIRGLAQAADGAGMLTVVANHFKSKLGGDGPEPRRQMQGQYLGEWVDARRAAQPQTAIVVVGDLNANFGDGAYEKLANRKDGSSRLYDSLLSLPPRERYSYIYRGQKNALDHLMVDVGHQDAMIGVHHARLATPSGSAGQKDNPKTARGVSDHDMMMVDFDLAKLLAPKGR